MATMNKIARDDWKRHSAPYDFSFDYTQYKTSVSEMFDQAMEAFTEEVGQKGTATMGRERKKSGGSKLSLYSADLNELSTNQYTPGVLKIFGETILPGVQYKSVLASCRSTAQELVKQALERYGLPCLDYQKFVLCDVVGRSESGAPDESDTEEDSRSSEKWERKYVRILADRDRPLLLQKFWKPIEGFSRRYELHDRDHVTDLAEDDDTSGLNTNARKILMSKLRPGAIPLFDPTTADCYSNGLSMNFKNPVLSNSTFCSAESSENEYTSAVELSREFKRQASEDKSTAIPSKHPFFVNIRGFNVSRDRTIYIIKSKRFQFTNPDAADENDADAVPKFELFAPDIESVHCNFKVYKFKKSNGTSKSTSERNNYFLELEPLANNISVNGHVISGKSVVKSGDILSLGIHYVFVFKDCSKGFDVPLTLPWLPTGDEYLNGDTGNSDKHDLHLNLVPPDDETKSSTDESVDVSIAERMSFAYTKDKEDELVKYICAIIQQQNTCKTYALTVSNVFSMCIEYASRKFERRQLKHLFLRILFTVRENVAETAKSLSASKFSCTLLDTASPQSERDQKLERLLLWISNCVQLLLFLKHTFQLPELPLTDRSTGRGRCEKSPRKEDSAKHALGQLVTGLEEIIMFCFQQCVYTLTKALHPALPALLDSNPFSEGNSEHSSMEDVIRLFETLAEVTHSVMLHEGITRQLFTYLFFFTNTNVFNKLLVDGSGVQYYNWQSGVRMRANLGQLEDWATQNGLEDEFGQMFERLLAASELLATSKNTLVKYQWPMMKTHYQPLTPGQLNHLLTNYQLGVRTLPAIWSPTQEDLDAIQDEEISGVSLSSHPPFALPDNCGAIDLIRSPEDASFWSHLRRLKSLYGVAEDDSDSGFSISNTPRGSTVMSKSELGEPFYEQENKETPVSKPDAKLSSKEPGSAPVASANKPKSRIPLKKSNTNPWSFKVPKPGTGVCECANAACNGDSTSTARTLATDLMKEEHRENGESQDCSNEPTDKLIAAIQAKSIKINMCSKPDNNKCKSENKEKQTPRYVQKISGNVADCSARTLPRASLHLRERSNSASVVKHMTLNGTGRKLDHTQSLSLEDVRRQRHKPSDSFVKAIERGLHPEKEVTEKCDKRKDEFDDGYSTVKRVSIVQKKIKERDGIVSTSENAAGDDEVFVPENDIDKLYSSVKAAKNVNMKNLNVKSASKIMDKPDISVNTLRNKGPVKALRSTSQKLMAVSFDSGNPRRSSIELTKDDLFINGVEHALERTGDAEEMTETNALEVYPNEIFTEVSESTLAALKRHGSSLNVAPSCENSPRSPVDGLMEVDPEDKKRMAPCPLFTVYLQKGDDGLGLGLIDGLHTPLRLSGIYIRKILAESPAAVNGCLQVGDRVLAVNGKSVIGADYQSTMNVIKGAGNTLTLLIARGNESMAKKVSVSQL